MNEDIYFVDSFTAKPFGGNPAGVVVLRGLRGDDWLQSIAKEIKLSETAFILEKEGINHLRWFTPLIEVSLCGHATLAAAHVMFTHILSTKRNEILFETKSGPILCFQKDGWIWMRFPKYNLKPLNFHDDVTAAIGSTPKEVYKTGDNILAIFDDPQTINQCTPDLERITLLGGQGVIISSISKEKGFDFISRYFAPNIGIPEDPVTGSSHSSLAPYWAERLGKPELIAKQVSARGGILKTNVLEQAVEIGGQASLVIAGKIIG